MKTMTFDEITNLYVAQCDVDDYDEHDANDVDCECAMCEFLDLINLASERHSSFDDACALHSFAIDFENRCVVYDETKLQNVDIVIEQMQSRFDDDDDVCNDLFNSDIQYDALYASSCIVEQLRDNA